MRVLPSRYVAALTSAEAIVVAATVALHQVWNGYLQWSSATADHAMPATQWRDVWAFS